MKCILDATNLKTWSRIITAMTTIGDEEIHFAFTDRSVTLSTFNASLSVSCTCTFFSTFFQKFDVRRGYVKTFKLPSKCIMKPFRSMRFITKSCTFCEIGFEDTRDTVIMTIGCKSLAEIRYTIKILEDNDNMQIECDPDKLSNWIRTEPKFMLSNLSHFTHGKGLVDLTLKSQGNKVVLKNCATDLMRKDEKIYTEVSLSTSAFDRFTITEDTEVTFQHKDFKTFIQLAEFMKLPIKFHFQGPRDPAILTLKNELVEATLILATKFVEADEISQTSEASSGFSTKISNVSSVTVPEPAHYEPLHLPPRSKKKQQQTNNRVIEKELEEIEKNEKMRISRKKTRDLFKRITAPYDIYKQFPGHDIILVEGSDDDDDEEND